MSKPGPFTGRRGWVLATVAAVVLASALLDGALATTTSAPAADRFTPLVQSVMSTPRWFTGVDRRVHLVYEVQLINDFPTPLALRSVAVRNANGGRIITRLTGTKLLASMSLLASPTEPTTTVPSSGIGVVWFDVVLPNARALPPSIKHTVTVVVPPGLPGPRTVTYSGAFARVDVRPPVVIGPPLRGRGWIAIGSCCDGPHRRSGPARKRPALSRSTVRDRLERFRFTAPVRRRQSGHPHELVFYGKPLLAVAGARVVAAVDRFPDQIPNHPKPVTINEADGNYIILALGGGRFAFHAHLKPGSVRVRLGERVRRGEVIARIGNSGSSTRQHLHFQVMDRPSALASDGLPYVFDRFRFTGGFLRWMPRSRPRSTRVNRWPSIPPAGVLVAPNCCSGGRGQLRHRLTVPLGGRSTDVIGPLCQRPGFLLRDDAVASHVTWVGSAGGRRGLPGGSSEIACGRPQLILCTPSAVAAQTLRQAKEPVRETEPTRSRRGPSAPRRAPATRRPVTPVAPSTTTSTSRSTRQPTHR